MPDVKSAVEASERPGAAPVEAITAEHRLGRKYLIGLAAAAIVGSLLVIPYGSWLVHGDPWAFWIGPGVFAYGLILQGSIYALAVWIGSRAARSAGLGWPPLAGYSASAASRDWGMLRRTLLVAAGIGVACGLLLPLFGRAFPAPTQPVPDAAWWAAALGSIGAGLNEEVLFRFGAMSIFVWAGSKIARQREPGAAVVWTGNVLAALLFGAIHLPQAELYFDLTPGLIALVLIPNGIVGIACGWLYWRKGIVAAMVAHAMTNVTLRLLLPAVSIFA